MSSPPVTTAENSGPHATEETLRLLSVVISTGKRSDVGLPVPNCPLSFLPLLVSRERLVFRRNAAIIRSHLKHSECFNFLRSLWEVRTKSKRPGRSCRVLALPCLATIVDCDSPSEFFVPFLEVVVYKTARSMHTSQQLGGLPNKVWQGATADLMAEGDLIILFAGRDRVNCITLQQNATFRNKFGDFPHNNIIGKQYGSKVRTNYGRK